jgi:hypothetical protein
MNIGLPERSSIDGVEIQRCGLHPHARIVLSDVQSSRGSNRDALYDLVCRVRDDIYAIPVRIAREDQVVCGVVSGRIGRTRSGHEVRAVSRERPRRLGDVGEEASSCLCYLSRRCADQRHRSILCHGSSAGGSERDRHTLSRRKHAGRESRGRSRRQTTHRRSNVEIHAADRIHRCPVLNAAGAADRYSYLSRKRCKEVEIWRRTRAHREIEVAFASRGPSRSAQGQVVSSSGCGVRGLKAQGDPTWGQRHASICRGNPRRQVSKSQSPIAAYIHFGGLYGKGETASGINRRRRRSGAQRERRRT